MNRSLKSLINSIRIEELTSPEIGQAIKSGYDTIVVALGSCEQHGPCLPISTDTLLGTEIAITVAKKLGKALVGPTVNIGCSEHHMKFPGSITFQKETFQNVVKDICRSVSLHGFKTIILLPSHGGNFSPLSEILGGVRNMLPNVDVIAYTDLMKFVDVMFGTASKLGISKEDSGAHAGEAEVSLMMHIREDLVKHDKVSSAKGYIGTFDSEATAKIFKDGIGALSPIGVLGSPLRSNKSHGKEYLEDLTSAIVDYIIKEQDK